MFFLFIIYYFSQWSSHNRHMVNYKFTKYKDGLYLQLLKNKDVQYISITIRSFIFSPIIFCTWSFCFLYTYPLHICLYCIFPFSFLTNMCPCLPAWHQKCFVWSYSCDHVLHLWMNIFEQQQILSEIFKIQEIWVQNFKGLLYFIPSNAPYMYNMVLDSDIEGNKSLTHPTVQLMAVSTKLIRFWSSPEEQKELPGTLHWTGGPISSNTYSL